MKEVLRDLSSISPISFQFSFMSTGLACVNARVILIIHRRLYCSWLGLNLLKFGCFLMLSHRVEQGNEAPASLHCFGVMPSKSLLTNGQGTRIPGSCLLAVALCLPKLCK